MAIKRRTLRALLPVVIVGSAIATLQAEEVHKKWRLSLALGGYNAQDEIESSASNTFTVINQQVFTTGLGQDDPISAQYQDPRDDSSVFGALDLKSGPLGTFAAQYALTQTFIIEGSVGYQVSDLGDIEVAAQFDGRQPEIPEIPFAFDAFNVPAGEVERLPLQLDGLLRFRPRAKFNPYVGAGIGYAFVGFEPSPELNELSVRMDSSTGRQCRLTNSYQSTPTLDCSSGSVSVPRDLQGAQVSARDSFEWNLAAGAELSFKRRMAAFIDLRWVDASRQIELAFDGASELGVSVPQLTDFDTSVAAQTTYGGVAIPNGGLIDDGLLWALPRPQIQIVPTGCTDPFSQACIDYCQTFPTDCFINYIQSPGSGRTLVSPLTGEVYTDLDEGPGDGRADPGIYYVKGGKLSYDGFSLQLGFRYTF